MKLLLACDEGFLFFLSDFLQEQLDLVCQLGYLPSLLSFM